jgi:spore coat assembly protein SafA
MSDELDRVEGMQALPPPPTCPNGQIYTVMQGDTMFTIAQRYGLPLQRLIDANPQVVNPNLIYPGQQLCIPAAAAGCPPGATTYTVVRGDTLFMIAQRYGVTLNALLQANPQITNPDLIFPGQVICIPVAPGPPMCPNGFLYTVVRGDTLFEISRRYGITLDALLRANPQITNPNLINPGQLICIPFPPQPSFCSGQYYTVRRGDTLSCISRRTGVSVEAILAANPQIIDPDRIFAGQVICIPAVAVAPPAPIPVPPRPVPPIPLPVPVPLPEPPLPPVERPCPPERPMPGYPECPGYGYMPYMCPRPWDRCPEWERCKKRKKRKHKEECYYNYANCPWYRKRSCHDDCGHYPKKRR